MFYNNHMQDFRQIHFKEIDSTNDYLKNSYGLLSNFTFVTADYQNKGKGRNNRLWTSEPGENLMFSFLIKDKRLINQSLIISFVAAIEVAIVLESFGIKNVSIKWPNDVLVGDKKICGILAEGQVPDYLVVGVGLNVNQKSFPNDLRRPATSIALELDKEVPIDDIKDTLFKRIVTSLNSFRRPPRPCPPGTGGRRRRARPGPSYGREAFCRRPSRGPAAL